MSFSTPDSSTVTVTIEPDPAGSRVTLVHEGLADDQAAMHAEGWHHYLDRLVRLASTGDAGADEWAWAPENLTPVSAAEAALDAWRSVDLDGTVPGPAGAPMPAAFLAGILPIEILVHGWDLAQGTGQRLHVSDEVVAYVRTLAEDVVPTGRGRSFGDEVRSGHEATALDRLAAYAGRSPSRSEHPSTTRRTVMTKYLFIYHAPMTPADAAPPDPQQMEAAMGEWNAWAGKVGEGLLDLGTPLAGGVRVAADGSTSPSTTEVAGYSLLEAADLDAALALAKDHPHLRMPGGGCEIEVHEAQPIPGM